MSNVKKCFSLCVTDTKIFEDLKILKTYLILIAIKLFQYIIR